jgi:hypothetical protein
LSSCPELYQLRLVSRTAASRLVPDAADWLNSLVLSV